MKIKLKTIYTLIVSLIIIVNEKYFFMTDNFGNWIIALITLTLLLTIWNLLKDNKENFYFKHFVIAYLIMNMITMLNTILTYGQAIELAINKYKFIIIILLYFPLKRIIKKVGVNKVDKIIISLAVFSACIMIMQKITYGQLTIIHNGNMLRDGNFRNFQIQNIVSIAIVILTQYLLQPKKDYKFKSKKRIIMLLIPLLYYTTSISMTRSSEMALLGTIFITIWINIKTRLRKKELKIYWNGISIFIFGVLTFIGYKYFIEIISSSISMGESSSVQRIGAINYYINKFIDSPLFGYGLYNKCYEYGLLLTGDNLRYYVDDVGIFGYIFQYGIIGIGLLIYLMLQINKKFKKLSQINKNKYLCIYIYFIILLPFNILLNLDTGIIYICLFLISLEICTEKEIA